MPKNYFMVKRDQGHPADAVWSLDEAAKMFSAVYQQRPDDPSVWNGLGSVVMLRGNPRLALQYIDQALLLQPEYPEALHDRAVALAALQAREKPVAPGSP